MAPETVPFDLCASTELFPWIASAEIHRSRSSGFLLAVFVTIPGNILMLQKKTFMRALLGIWEFMEHSREVRHRPG